MAEGFSLKPQSRLFTSDGSLLFLMLAAIMEVKRQRDDARDRAQHSDHVDDDRKRSDMYHLPREDFPRELHTSLHSAHAG